MLTRRSFTQWLAGVAALGWLPWRKPPEPQIYIVAWEDRYQAAKLLAPDGRFGSVRIHGKGMIKEPSGWVRFQVAVIEAFPVGWSE